MADGRTSGRRAWRVAALVAAVLVGLPFVLLAGLWGFAQTEGGRGLLTQMASGMLSHEGTEVQLDGLSGRVPSDMALARLTVADAEGAWLRVEGIRLTWRPLRLLTGRLDVVEIAADTVAVDRLPDTPDEAAPQDAGLPRLPFDVRVARLAVGVLRLGEPVAGEAADLSIVGRIGARQEGRVRTELEVVRLDGPESRLQVRAAYDPTAQTAAVDVALGEPAGGLAARLLDLPDHPPVSVSFVGEGPLADWKGRLEVAATDLLRLDATVGIRVGQDVAVNLAGRAEPAPTLLGPWAEAVGHEASLEAVGSWRRAQRRVEIERVAVAGAAVTAELTGAVGLDDLAVTAKLSGEVTDGAAMAGLTAPASFASAQLEARIRGTVLRPDVDLEAVVYAPALDAVAADGMRLTGGIRAAAGGADRWSLHADLALAAARFPAAAAALLGPTPSLQFRGLLDDSDLVVEHLAVTGHAAEAAATGSVALATGSLDLAVDAAVADLAALREATGLDAVGRVQVSALVRADGWGEDAHMVVTAGAQGVRVGEPGLARLIGATPGLFAEVAYGGAFGLRVEDAVAEVAVGRVRASATLPPGLDSVSAEFAVGVPDVAVLSDLLGQPVSGRLDVKGRLEGPLADPGLDVDAALGRGRLGGLQIAGATAAARVRALATAPQGTVTLAARTGHGPLEAQTRFALEGQTRLRLEDIRLDLADAAVRGGVAVDLAGPTADGRLELAAPNLAGLAAIAGVPLSGGGSGTIVLAAPRGQQSARAEFAFSGMRYEGEGGPVALADARISGSVDDLFGTPALQAQANAGELDVGGASVETLQVAVAGAIDALQVSLRATARAPAAAELAAEALLQSPTGEAPTARIDAFRGRYGEVVFALEEPATVGWGANGLSLSGLSLAVGEGRVAGSASLGTTAVSVALDATALPVEAIRMAWPDLPLGGNLSLALRMQGDPGAPEASLDASLADLRSLTRPSRAAVAAGTAAIDRETLGRLRLDVRANLQGGMARAEAVIGGLPDGEAMAHAAFPFGLSLQPFAVSLPEDGAVQGAARASADMDSLWALIGLDGHRLAGRADAALTVAGTISRPTVSGQAEVSNGRYENLFAGTVLDDLAIAIQADGEGWSLARFTATDGGRGRIAATGGGGFGGAAVMSGRIDLDVTEATLVRRDDLTAIAGGGLTFMRDDTGMSLVGRVQLGPVEARIDGDLPPGVVDLEVREVGGGIEPQAGPETEDGAVALPVALDITVAMPNRIFVRGRGLDSEWGGELQIGGTAAAPVIEGAIQPIRGQFDFVGRVFRLAGGSIVFDGGDDVDPALDVTAEHQAGDVTAIVQISGRASAPEISLSSQPEMPRDEILSRVLFGRALARLSALEAIQIAQAAATLGGMGGGGFMEQVRQSLGVDVLRVGGGEDGPTVAAGRYIGERVYLGVEQGAASGSSAATIEVEVTDNIVVESRMGADATGNVGVKWKWDY